MEDIFQLAKMEAQSSSYKFWLDLCVYCTFINLWLDSADKRKPKASITGTIKNHKGIVEFSLDVDKTTLMS